MQRLGFVGLVLQSISLNLPHGPEHHTVQLSHSLACLTHSGLQVQFEGVEYKVLPALKDSPATIIGCEFENCFQFIDAGIQNGETVLVHCWRGISRSATIVAMYLMCAYGMSTSQAIDLLKKSRPCIDPNPGFATQLLILGSITPQERLSQIDPSKWFKLYGNWCGRLDPGDCPL